MSKRLPENLEAPTLDTMLPDEWAVTVPWAMWVDRDRRCWLHPGYTAYDTPSGTVQMQVHRLQDGTYEVDVRNLAHRWAPTASPTYAGEHGDWLTVSNLITGEPF